MIVEAYRGNERLSNSSLTWVLARVVKYFKYKYFKYVFEIHAMYFVFEANSKCILYFVFKYKINCIYVFQIHINKFKYLCAIFMTFTFVSGILGTVINALAVFYNEPIF